MIPNSVRSIGNFAFCGCSALTSVVIGNNVESIGNDAFRYCVSLKSVVIPGKVESIGNNAFEGCSGLTSVTFNDTSAQYMTKEKTNWENKTDGTNMDVTVSTDNVAHFKDNNYCNYWYKL